MYGILFATSLILCSFLAQKLAENKAISKDLIFDSIFYSVIGGIIGARLFHVVDYWSYYSINPVKILEVYNGGLGIVGGIFGGVAAFYLYSKAARIPAHKVLAMLDIFGTLLPLAQAISRWGNYFNNEVFGLPTQNPVALYIPYAARPENYKFFEKFHPLFLYESVLCLSIFVTLYYLLTKAKTEKNLRIKMFDGDIFLLYLLGYGLVRLVLEPFRLRHFYLLGVNTVTATALFSVFLSAALLILRRKNGTSKEPQRS